MLFRSNPTLPINQFISYNRSSSIGQSPIPQPNRSTIPYTKSTSMQYPQGPTEYPQLSYQSPYQPPYQPPYQQPYQQPYQPPYQLPSQPSPQSPSQPSSQSPSQPPSQPTLGVVVDYSALFGNDSPNSTGFNDLEEVVRPASIKGNRVRLSRIKLYKNGNGILGIKFAYIITDPSGKETKIERPHRSKDVGFFTSRKSMNLSGTERFVLLNGCYSDRITKLRIATNTQTIEFGTASSNTFEMSPKPNQEIIAFSGSVGNFLNTLRAP